MKSYVLLDVMLFSNHGTRINNIFIFKRQQMFIHLEIIKMCDERRKYLINHVQSPFWLLLVNLIALIENIANILIKSNKLPTKINLRIAFK